MKKILLAGAAFLASVGVAFAMGTYTFQDASNVIHTFVTVLPCGGFECSAQVIVDNNGNPMGIPSSPLNIQGTSLNTIAANTSTFVAAVSHAQLASAANNLVAKATGGSIIAIDGSVATGAFVMVFDAASAPSDGAVTPLKCYGPLTGAQPFRYTWGVGPVLATTTGITVVSSSTGCFTKTGTNFVFLSVEYQ